LRDVRKYEVFQLSDQLVLEVYRLTGGLPKSELFGLTSQMRRAASSIRAGRGQVLRACCPNRFVPLDCTFGLCNVHPPSSDLPRNLVPKKRESRPACLGNRPLNLDIREGSKDRDALGDCRSQISDCRSQSEYSVNSRRRIRKAKR
jgi:hypothetical protein